MNGTPLKDVVDRVAELFGERPAVVSIRFSNGSRVRVESNDSKPNSLGDSLTQEEKKRFETWSNRIMPYMHKMQIPLLRKQIAQGLGLDLKKKQATSGWFGRTVIWLVRNSELIENDEGFLSLPGSELVEDEDE